jgi:hypothetical protein
MPTPIVFEDVAPVEHLYHATRRSVLSCNVRKWNCWPIEYADLFVVGVTGAKSLRRAEKCD